MESTLLPAPIITEEETAKVVPPVAVCLSRSDNSIVGYFTDGPEHYGDISPEWFLLEITRKQHEEAVLMNATHFATAPELLPYRIDGFVL
jgi:hypothetical protein